jgi:hypothetical protein
MINIYKSILKQNCAKKFFCNSIPRLAGTVHCPYLKDFFDLKYVKNTLIDVYSSINFCKDEFN